MSDLILYRDPLHQNILLPDATGQGLAVQANHHVIVHRGQALLLDPGGHKVFNQIFSDVSSLNGAPEVTHIFLSHQDPDIVAATNGWLMITDANAYVSELWTRFVPHFGVDALLEERLIAIPDGGCWLDLAGSELLVLPAHFLHSCGNFQLYDPTAKILYTGDLGASIGTAAREVTDFDAHLPYITAFHRRYMASGAILKRWVAMVRALDIDIIAPQHGALLRGKTLVDTFLDWCENLECGLDLMQNTYQIPPKA